MPELIKSAQVPHAYQALAFVCYGFYPKTKGRNAADNTIKFFAQKLLHILHLLIFIAGTFSFHGTSFPVAAMLAFFIHLFINLKILFQALLQYAVYQHIRIAAYGRCKMTIVFKPQSVMPNILRCVNCLGHGADA